MAKIKLYYDNGPGKGKAYFFMCPGCGEKHAFWVRNNDGSEGWKWNGDFEKPMVHPSIKVTTPGGKPGAVCHSFITYGRIQFLDDCTHELRGKTVELPDID